MQFHAPPPWKAWEAGQRQFYSKCSKGVGFLLWSFAGGRIAGVLQGKDRRLGPTCGYSIKRAAHCTRLRLCPAYFRTVLVVPSHLLSMRFLCNDTKLCVRSIQPLPLCRSPGECASYAGRYGQRGVAATYLRREPSLSDTRNMFLGTYRDHRGPE